MYFCKDSKAKGVTIKSISPLSLITTVVLVPVSLRKDTISSSQSKKINFSSRI